MPDHRRPPPSLRALLLLGVAAALFVPTLLWLLVEAGFGVSLAGHLRAAVLLMVMVQAIAAVVVVLRLLGTRLDDPLDRLVGHLQGVASERPVPALGWPAGDDFGPLAREVDTVHARLVELRHELRAGETRLQKAVMYDALTGLPNRVLMRELFEHEAASARRSERTLALLHLGVDRFRTYNDTLGHEAGDELLTGLAHRLAATLRDSDYICRAPGDEFLVLLPVAGGWDQVASAAERLLRAIEEPLELPRSRQLLSVSASLGVAMYPSDGTAFEPLARAAALALDRSKALGRGLYSFYQPALDQALRRRIDAERELALALERNEFELHYQPVVDALTLAPVGCEALLRWRHPGRGLLLPGAFIDAARQCGLIRDIDAWVLERACSDLARWRGQRLDPGRVAINLSVQQARNPALSDILRRAIDRCGLEPRLLELEVTEDAFIDEPEGVPRALARWRGLGLALTVDDFGVGYSSLSQLKKLRPERLKLDCSLVAGLPDAADDCALAEAMLAMARALQIEVVAEGVETSAQRQWLLDHGCRRQQGHLYGQPMPEARFVACLQPAERTEHAPVD